MKVFKVKNVMRTTVEINNLIELTQGFLNNKINQYYSEVRLDSAPEELIPKLQQDSSEAINNTERKPKVSNEQLGGKPGDPDNFASASSVDANLAHSKEITDYDELYKLISTESKANKRNPQKKKEGDKSSRSSHPISLHM